jgi:BrnA antitoxin of type II toxin-antitoxin system
MTNDLSDPIDFSEMEKRQPSLSEMNDFANSLPSIMGDAAVLGELLDRPLSTDPVPKTATFDTSASSIRVTIRLASDVWKSYREAAVHRGVHYQTLINNTLREAIPIL